MSHTRGTTFVPTGAQISKISTWTAVFSQAPVNQALDYIQPMRAGTFAVQGDKGGSTNSRQHTGTEQHTATTRVYKAQDTTLCVTQYPFQSDYPHSPPPRNAVAPVGYDVQQLQAYPLPTYGSPSQYSPTSPVDRPSPSFRIDDILLQSKNGHHVAPSSPSYAAATASVLPLLPNGFASGPNSSNAAMNHHAFSYRLAHHAMPHLQHQSHPSAAGMPPAMHTCASPTEKEYQGPSPSVLNTLPVYFRLKPALRTASGRKCRKPRTVFSELQLMVLNREFTEHKYLNTPQRTKLAERLGLNQTQVKTWFQNRRMKWKKETTEKERKSDEDGEMMHSDSENSNAEEDSC
eukprot:gene13789-15232_t